MYSIADYSVYRCTAQRQIGGVYAAGCQGAPEVSMLLSRGGIQCSSVGEYRGSSRRQYSTLLWNTGEAMVE